MIVSGDCIVNSSESLVAKFREVVMFIIQKRQLSMSKFQAQVKSRRLTKVLILY
jgi:hypothetical protein